MFQTANIGNRFLFIKMYASLIVGILYLLIYIRGNALVRNCPVGQVQKRTAGAFGTAPAVMKVYLWTDYFMPSFFLMSLGSASLWTRMFMVL